MSDELIEAFELGFSDPQGQALTRKLAEERFSPEQMEASGLVRRRSEGSGFYDYFRGRLVFPIHNESGKVIAFGARAMRADDQPKSELVKPSQNDAKPTQGSAANPKPLSDAIKHGLAYLVSQQHKDGGWGQGGGWRSPANETVSTAGGF